MRKPFYKGLPDAATLEEVYAAQVWLDEHFVIIDEGDQHFGFDDFYHTADEIEAALGRKVDTTTVDPWNEFNHSFTGYDGREDKYLEAKLTEVRKNARQHLRHNFITTHIVKQEKRFTGELGYYPPPTPRELAGGQAWYRKAECMIGVWRPPYAEGMTPEYEKNETKLLVSKVKPKGVGATGECSMFYDKHTGRFYEAGGHYAGEQGR
ncbi:MAG: hypothetical protein IH599_00035 [Bacteroidales bacterium]|nr:hypothetical protein [Bacteroidales bacterium]